MYEFHDEAWADVSPEAMDMIKKMLCVNQKKRWTAQQLLAHPWIVDEKGHLEQKSLSTSIITMKRLAVRRRFKAAIRTVIFTNRMSRLFGVGSTPSTTSASTVDNATISAATLMTSPSAPNAPSSSHTSPTTAAVMATAVMATYTIDSPLIPMASEQAPAAACIGAVGAADGVGNGGGGGGQSVHKVALKGANIGLNTITDEVSFTCTDTTYNTGNSSSCNNNLNNN